VTPQFQFISGLLQSVHKKELEEKEFKETPAQHLCSLSQAAFTSIPMDAIMIHRLYGLCTKFPEPQFHLVVSSCSDYCTILTVSSVTCNIGQ